jgi:hypothetical protein
MEMSRKVSPRIMPQAGRDYIARNDAAHRGSPLARIRREVLAALPGRA